MAFLEGYEWVQIGDVLYAFLWYIYEKRSYALRNSLMLSWAI